MSSWLTVLTSAAVGALVSALVHAISAWRERTARRKELLLTKSIELAIRRNDLLMKAAEQTREEVPLYDTPSLAEVYFYWLGHLMDKGRLPKEAPNRFPGLLGEQVPTKKSDAEKPKA